MTRPAEGWVRGAQRPDALAQLRAANRAQRKAAKAAAKPARKRNVGGGRDHVGGHELGEDGKEEEVLVKRLWVRFVQGGLCNGK